MMSDLHNGTPEELSDTSAPHSTDPGLSQLKEQTKNIMIPLLIKVFQIRLEAQQIVAPPSRLTSAQPKASLQDLLTQLSNLDEDLKLQYIWIESTRTQIEKIITELKQEHPNFLHNHVKKEETSDPIIQKSFQDVISSKKNNSTNSDTTIKHSWFRKILGK